MPYEWHNDIAYRCLKLDRATQLEFGISFSIKIKISWMNSISISIWHYVTHSPLFNWLENHSICLILNLFVWLISRFSVRSIQQNRTSWSNQIDSKLILTLSAMGGFWTNISKCSEGVKLNLSIFFHRDIRNK